MSSIENSSNPSSDFRKGYRWAEWQVLNRKDVMGLSDIESEQYVRQLRKSCYKYAFGDVKSYKGEKSREFYRGAYSSLTENFL